MVSASASYFVPKPFTPFQWAPMITPEEFQKRAYFVKDKFREAKNHKSLKFAYHEADITILEGLLARGDRKLCQVIYDVYQSGQIFDAWTEYFDKSNWDNALEKNHIDIGFYTYRDRSVVCIITAFLNLTFQNNISSNVQAAEKMIPGLYPSGTPWTDSKLS